MGLYSKALIYFDQAIIGQQRIGHSYTHASAAMLEGCRAKVLLQMGDYTKVANQLERLLGKSSAFTTSERLQLRHLLAESYARLQLEVLAEAQVNIAIEEALAEGAGPLLFRTCLAAARCCQLLGRTAEATAAYQRALQLLETTVEGQNINVKASDRTELYLGLAQCGQPSVEHLEAAVEAVADGLKEDAACWDRLPDLLRLLQQYPEADRQHIAATRAEAIQRLDKAASQRADCKKLRPYKEQAAASLN